MMLPSHLQLVPSLPSSEQPRALSFPTGRLIEISGDNHCARRTTAVAAVLEAQTRGEPTAWVQFSTGSLYPPDLDESGVDLGGVAVILIPPQDGGYALLKAAELLLRSGGIGLVVVDLGRSALRNTDTAWQGRLLGLVREHHATMLLLTEKAAGTDSLGPLISLRIEPQRQRLRRGLFTIDHRILKNKIGLLNPLPDQVRGPWGLR